MVTTALKHLKDVFELSHIKSMDTLPAEFNMDFKRVWTCMTHTYSTHKQT